MGLKVDFDKRLDSVQSSFFSRMKNRVKTVAQSTGIAIGGAAAINSVDPVILSAPINGTIIGSIFSKLSESKIIGQIAGLSSGAASAFLEYLPVVGETIENVNAMENLIVASIGGLGFGFIGCITSKIIKTIIKMHDKFRTQKDRKKILKLDSDRYYNENKEELKKMQEYLEKESNSIIEVILMKIKLHLL